MTPDQIDSIVNATSLTAFHAALAAAGVLGSDERFMHVEMDITSRCNIRCVMCYHSFDEYAKSKAVLFSVEAFDRLATAVLPRAHTLTLSLGSEPTTSPYFPAILRAAGRNAVPNLTFFTNATLLSDDLIGIILESRVTQICVSIDGATATTYEAIRRGASFERVIDNVRRLAAARAGPRGLPRLRFDVVMMKRNAHEWPAIVDLAASLGVDAVNFFHMVVYEGLGTTQQSLRLHQDLSDLWLQRALDRAAATGVAVTSHPQLFEQQRTASAPAPSPYVDTPYCMYPFFHVSMNSGGHVLPCPFSHGVAPFGTVDESHGLEAVWLGRGFSELRRNILENDPPAMCRRCSFLASRYPNVEALFAPRRAI